MSLMESTLTDEMKAGGGVSKPCKVGDTNCCLASCDETCTEDSEGGSGGCLKRIRNLVDGAQMVEQAVSLQDANKPRVTPHAKLAAYARTIGVQRTYLLKRQKEEKQQTKLKKKHKLKP